MPPGSFSKHLELLPQSLTAFRTSTEDTDEFDDIFCDDKKTTTENVVEIEKKLTKKKFAAFGKVKQRNNNQTES